LHNQLKTIEKRRNTFFYWKSLNINYIARIFLLFSVLAPRFLQAEIEKDSTKKTHYLLVPLLLRSPETRWATGLTGSISFKSVDKNDSLTRTSTIQGVLMFTQRQQNVQAIDTKIFFPKENYIFFLQLSHSYYPDKYWGFGQHTQEVQEEDYSFEQLYFFPHLKRKIAKDFFAGVLYEYQTVYNIHYKDQGLYETTVGFGKNHYIVSGLGGSIAYDTRNSSFWPTKGILVQGQFTYFNNTFGSTCDYLNTILDVRYFKKIFRNTVIATQLYNFSTDGDVPIRGLAMLGGASNLRGFYQGRYRDHNMATLIGEYRKPIYKRFSACIFAGIGNVYRKLEELTSSSLKSSYGAGVRFSILPKEKLNIRIDYGYANNLNKGLYFTVGECF
jgi:outer membrane protein assembly factor BamA